MKNYLALSIVLLLTITNSAQIFGQSYAVSGYVSDSETGETIIGVNVIVQNTSKGAATDGNGFFRITGLSPGQYMLMYSHIAYERKIRQVTVVDKSIIQTETPLHPKAVELNEIVVLGNKSDVADPEIEMGHLEMTPRAVQTIPASQGDVFRALKYMPGIAGIDRFSPLYSARGSDPGENLVLLDGVTIYNPYHFISASGLFNLYAIKNIEMLVGGFGAEYGGRNSSVLYITTREGNNKKLHGEIQPTSTHTKAVFDFPVGENAAMMISARAYYDLVSRFLFYSPSYFYDANISFNWKINNQNRLILRYFHSKDLFDYSFRRISSYFSTTFDLDIYDDFDVIYKNKWRNQAITAILKTVISPRAYLQTQMSGSFFSSNNLSELDFEYTDDETGETYKLNYKTDILNNIQDWSGKSVLSLKLNSANTFKLGAEFSYYNFDNELKINNFSEGKSERKPQLLATFIEDKISLGHFIFRPGVRLSKFSFTNKSYSEPRFNGAVDITHNLRLKTAWGRYYQYIISMNTQEYEISQFLDYYYPLKEQKPSTSTHYVFGIEKTFTTNSKLSIDFFFKDILRVYTFDLNLSEAEILSFSDKLRKGSGESYGMEILWQGTWQRFSGWASYGISRARRSYSHINDGKSYLFDYDRTHSFKAVINHQIHQALSYSGSLRILSGVPKTLERSIKSYFYYDPLSNELSTYPTYIADWKNNIRLPIYIQLDIGIQKRIRKGFGAELAKFLGANESYLNVSLGNLLLFHRNVWFYIPTGEEKYLSIGTNYFPEISMGYSIKF